MSLVPNLGRLAPIACALAALLLVTACVTEKAVVEATGAPVGAGVNVPAGSNEDFIVNVGRRIYFDEGSAEINDVAKATLQNRPIGLPATPATRSRSRVSPTTAGPPTRT